MDDTHSAVEQGARAGWREWVGLVVLVIPALVLAMDVSVLYLALPRLSADLGAGSVQQLWILDIYGFMIAGLLVTMGSLGDRIGRRRLLLIGAAAFGLASLLAAYSVSPEMLIATRALLGIAGATLMPSTLALIRNMFQDRKQRQVAIALWLSCMLGGTAFGPVVGGVLLEFFWWGSVFLLNVPVMALLLAIAPVLVPEYRDPTPGRLDPVSAMLSLGAILPVIYGLKELSKGGVGALPLVAIVLGLGIGVLFVNRQRKLSTPLVDMRLFGKGAFRAALMVLLIGTAIIGGIYLLVSQYLQLVKGLSPLRSGLWLVPPTIAMAAGAMLAPALSQRARPSTIVGIALVVSSLGFLLLTQVDSTSGAAPVVVAFGIVAIGMSATGALATDLVMGAAPPERAGSAASVSETCQELGLALGVAGLGVVTTALYRNQIADSLPADVPPGVAEAAGDSLAGAAGAAASLPDRLGAMVLDPARQAFTSGLNVSAAIGAVVVLVLAATTVTVLRNVSSGQGADKDEHAETAKGDGH